MQFGKIAGFLVEDAQEELRTGGACHIIRAETMKPLNFRNLKKRCHEWGRY